MRRLRGLPRYVPPFDKARPAQRTGELPTRPAPDIHTDNVRLGLLVRPSLYLGEPTA